MDFKKIATIVTIVFTVIIGTSGYLSNGFGLLTKIDSRYAKAGEFIKLNTKVQFNTSKIDLNRLRQLQLEAWSEYFTAKKLKKAHPNDVEVSEILEKAIAFKNLITIDYNEMKRKVAKLFEQVQK